MAFMSDVYRSHDGSIELRCGDYREALADVEAVDAVITDPPYSERTHKGHDAGANMANRKGGQIRANGKVDRFRPRTEISYATWSELDVLDFMSMWGHRASGWIACMSDSDLAQTWRAAYEKWERTGFQPVPCVIPGMTVRMAGDGPSSWAVYLNVSRPRSLKKWGTLPGSYVFGQGERVHIGGKPLALMRAIVRDYSRPGDLVCDPCAGGGTTLLAAVMEGRRAIGAELDPATFAKAVKRLREADRQTEMFTPRAAVKPKQEKLL